MCVGMSTKWITAIKPTFNNRWLRKRQHVCCPREKKGKKKQTQKHRRIFIQSACRAKMTDKTATITYTLCASTSTARTDSRHAARNVVIINLMEGAGLERGLGSLVDEKCG